MSEEEVLEEQMTNLSTGLVEEKEENRREVVVNIVMQHRNE